TDRQSPVELRRIVNLHQDVETELSRLRVQVAKLGIRQNADDQQDRVGSSGTRLQDLHRIDDEILAQKGQLDRLTHASQRLQTSPEELLVRENRECRGASGRVGAGDVDRV